MRVFRTHCASVGPNGTLLASTSLGPKQVQNGPKSPKTETHGSETRVSWVWYPYSETKFTWATSGWPFYCALSIFWPQMVFIRPFLARSAQVVSCGPEPKIGRILGGRRHFPPCAKPHFGGFQPSDGPNAPLAVAFARRVPVCPCFGVVLGRACRTEIGPKWVNNRSRITFFKSDPGPLGVPVDVF